MQLLHAIYANVLKAIAKQSLRIYMCADTVTPNLGYSPLSA